MKGNIIGFDRDSNTGAISGFDGKRYDFAASDWHGAARPRHGDLVDFVPEGQRAAQIYLIEPEYVEPTFMQFYFSPSGRASRSQYWLRYVLPVFAISVVLNMILGIATATDNTGLAALFGVLNSLFALATFWPAIAVLVKRMHDRNKSGWLVLLPSAIVVVAAIVVVTAAVSDSFATAIVLGIIFGLAMLAVAIWFFIEFGCMRGTIGTNRYGPDPVVVR